MNESDTSAFASLFRDAFVQCFGSPLKTPLTESESKLLSNAILQRTGLVIGWKSIKNYSLYVLHDSPDKQENPSIATLDTLARYVLDAPSTDEIQRQKYEDHYPYWFEYKDQFHRSSKKPLTKRALFVGVVSVAAVAVVITLLISIHPFQPAAFELFTDDFHAVADDSLTSRGWFLKLEAAEYWNRRGEKPGHLALYTLRGDNWPDSSELPGIKNLLLRRIPSDCFTVEAQLVDFVPRENWEQAGIILLEDTTFSRKSVRLSLAYNDFSGGFNKSKEILVQAITSRGKGFSKPEEIAHKPIFYLERGKENLIVDNLKNSALRIEKHGNAFRFLYSGGSMENAAFKEVVSQNFDMEPRYVGIFALKGFVNDSSYIPAYFKFFSLTSIACD